MDDSQLADVLTSPVERCRSVCVKLYGFLRTSKHAISFSVDLPYHENVKFHNWFNVNSNPQRHVRKAEGNVFS